MDDLEPSAIVTLCHQGASVETITGILARRYGLPEAQRRMRESLDRIATWQDERQRQPAPPSRPPPPRCAVRRRAVPVRGRPIGVVAVHRGAAATGNVVISASPETKTPAHGRGLVVNGACRSVRFAAACEAKSGEAEAAKRERPRFRDGSHFTPNPKLTVANRGLR